MINFWKPTAGKTNFSIKDYFSKCDQILKGKLKIFCSDLCYVQALLTTYFHSSMLNCMEGYLIKWVLGVGWGQVNYLNFKIDYSLMIIKCSIEWFLSKKVFWLYIIQKVFENCFKVLISAYEKLIWYYVEFNRQNGLSTL